VLRAAVPVGGEIRLACPGPPGLADPRLWVATRGELLAVDLASRRVAHRARLAGDPASLVVFASGGGVDLALRATSGGAPPIPAEDPPSSLRTTGTLPGDGLIPPPGGSRPAAAPIPSRGKEIATSLETR